MSETGSTSADLFGERHKKFMTGLDSEEYKRKREDRDLELRRQKRNDTLSRRRNITDIDHGWIQVDVVYKEDYSVEDLPEVVLAANSDNDDLKLFAAQALRKMLSVHESPPIQQVIDAGVLSRVIEGIQRFDFSQLQYECAWTITNIVSGASIYTQTIIEKGAVPLLTNLLNSTNETVRDQAAWALGNVGGDVSHCRDLILKHGGMDLLIKCFETATRPSTVKNSSWAISNLCRGKPNPKYELISKALPTLAKVLASSQDVELLADCCWAIAQLSDGSKDRIQTLLDNDVIDSLLRLANSPSIAVQTAALRCCGNVASGTNTQTQKIIDQGLLSVASSALNNPVSSVRKEAVWIISNVSAGTIDQIQSLIEAEVYPRISLELANSEYDIKKEAVWAVSNVIAAATPEQALYLAECGALISLCSVLASKESGMLVVSLEGLRHFLQKGKLHFERQGVNPFAEQVQSCGGLDKLERLQSHPNTKIYEKAYKLIVEYFETEEDEFDNLLGAIRECSKFSL